MKRYCICLVVFIWSFLFIDTVTISASNTNLFDDFSSDSGLWEYQGVAYRDVNSEYVVLTNAQSSTWGHIWLKQSIADPFTVSFRYKTGGGTGADGFVLLFYQRKEGIGHQSTNVAGQMLSGRYNTYGYGIEFDNYQNTAYIADPSSNHIALRDQSDNHLAYVTDSRTEDNLWHDVTIIVGYTFVSVEVDSAEVLYWEGVLDRTNNAFGFGGACGADTNWAIIDDVIINPYPSEVTPSVLIDVFQVFNNRVDVNTTHNIRLHAKWDNETDISNGLIYINGREYITNSGGWVIFNDISSVVAKKTWKVAAVNCSGVYDFVQVASSPSIIWDKVNIVLIVEDSRIDPGTSAKVHWTATYEYDGSPFQGKVNVKGSITSQQLGKTAFTVESIQDEKYGLTSFTSNQANCVWDRIKIVEGRVTEGNAKIGNMETIWLKAEYEYDGIEFTDKDGVLYVNNVPLSWSSHDRQWKYSTTLDEPGSIVFEVTGVEDNRYGLTVINDEVGPLTITWERLFWETPVGIISIGGIIVVLVSAAIFFLRKRI